MSPFSAGQPEFCLVKPREPAIALGEFVTGTDNMRVDVYLGQGFRNVADAAIEGLLAEVAGEGEGRTTAQTSQQAVETFRQTYGKLLETGIHQARSRGPVSLVGLLQVAVVKYLTESVDVGLEKEIRRLKLDRAQLPKSTVHRSAQLQARVVRLSSGTARICTEVRRRLFEQLHRIESGPLGELERALMGGRVGIPPEVFLNPLLHAGRVDEDDVLLKRYVLLGRRAEDRHTVTTLRTVLNRVFGDLEPAADCRPDPVPGGRAGLETIGPGEPGATVGPATDPLFWLGAPENIDILLNRDRYLDFAAGVPRGGSPEDPQLRTRLRRHVRFQARRMRELDRTLAREGLVREMMAVSETRALAVDYGQQVNPQLLRQYLVGGPLGRQSWRKIRLLLRENGQRPALRRLSAAARRVRRPGRTDRRLKILQYLRDFAAYERDSRHFDIIRTAINGVCLVSGESELRTSRENNRLYEFVCGGDQQVARQVIRAHTVIKADVRGSTEVTAGLLRRGLNPASHFGANLFAPLRDLLELYGARKVFIEGDAAIMAISEFEHEPGNRFSVSRACGLARSLLEVVELHNQKNRALGLPVLELGIGIAFCDGAPAFLYDGDSAIMISPAINEADRLSSCSSGLHQRKGVSGSRHRVALFHLDPDQSGSSLVRGKEGALLRYNVNGIALGESAFRKLGTETALGEVRKRGAEGQQEHYRIGQYPLVSGALRTVVVRIGPVHYLWSGEQVAGQHCYEVVADPDLPDGSEAAAAAGKGSARTAEPRS